MREVTIRPYKRDDRAVVRQIAWETSFLGEPASAFFNDKDIVSDFLTLYFTDYEPGSCLVADLYGNTIGYLLGSCDVRMMRKAFSSYIIPHSLGAFFRRGLLLKKKEMAFIYHCLLSFIKGEFKLPDFSISYPATLHINIKEGFRNAQAGSQLIAVYLDYLAGRKVRGIHFTTMSDMASEFFKKLGFELLYKRRRSCFRYVTHKDVTVYVYGKKL